MVARSIPSLPDGLTSTDRAGNEWISFTPLPRACRQARAGPKASLRPFCWGSAVLQGGRTPALPSERCPAPLYPLLLARSFNDRLISHPTTFPVPVPAGTSHPLPGPCSARPGAARGTRSGGLQGSAGQGRGVLGREMQWGAGQRTLSGLTGSLHWERPFALAESRACLSQGGPRAHHAASNPFDATSPLPTPPSPQRVPAAGRIGPLGCAAGARRRVMDPSAPGLGLLHVLGMRRSLPGSGQRGSGRRRMRMATPCPGNNPSPGARPRSGATKDHPSSLRRAGFPAGVRFCAALFLER